MRLRAPYSSLYPYAIAFPVASGSPVGISFGMIVP